MIIKDIMLGVILEFNQYVIPKDIAKTNNDLQYTSFKNAKIDILIIFLSIKRRVNSQHIEIIIATTNTTSGGNPIFKHK